MRCPLALSLIALALALPALAQPPEGWWLDLYRGEPVVRDEVLADLLGSDVVFLGETHTVARHHALQAEVIAAFAEAGAPFCLGLEQMECVYQPILDRYNRGEATLEEVYAETKWEERWGNIRDYFPLLEAAHAAGAPIVALNARAEVVRKVGRGGLASLTPEERAELPPAMRLEDAPYRAQLRLALGVHAGMPEDRLANVCDAQIARDETMAESLVRFLGAEAGQGRKALVLAGSGHMQFGLGTPERVGDRLPSARLRIVLSSVSGELTLSAAEQAMAREVTITHDDMAYAPRPLADYLSVKPLQP